ncbi:S41 family peptidase [Alkaliphilus peptidifermentans]|uniref:Tricorn protease C1 domain-containing protein n=1 Tax=Alkaliphilus peptidifermentans DSM 18978 TaxID=1120976 RepID=A0A1G5AYL3_9FIRM|nr:S41 family peptidase [Alkaliphilus peptidifermentans]SCX82985.1 Tricorn protease C1 domain-containing protein [Alkaliphilus peptidifermentans DSM 18978]
MKRYVRLSFLYFILSILLLSACSRGSKPSTVAMEADYYGIIETNLTTEEKLEDFEHMYSLLEDNYSFFQVNKRLNNVDWLGNKRNYTRKIKNTTNDAEFFVAIDEILSDLNNSHVNVFNGEMYKRFYKHFYPYQHEILNYEKSKERYNFDGDVNNIEINEEYDFLIIQDDVLDTEIVIENEVAYMAIKSMSANHIREDYHKIENFLKGVEDYPKLIIDIRGNTGGFDDYWRNIVGFLVDEEMVVEYYSFYRGDYRDKYEMYQVGGASSIEDLNDDILLKFPPEVRKNFDRYEKNYVTVQPWNKINFQGRVYLLVDRYVFSSAEKFASFAKDSGFATLIGETTGGDRVFREIPFAYLPNSGFIIRFSSELGINVNYSINMETRTSPHIETDASISAILLEDKAIQAVIED